LKCPACDRGLAALEFHDPPSGPAAVVAAECCFGCVRPDGSPERSYALKTAGRYRLGGAGRDDRHDPNEARLTTAVTGSRRDGDLTLFETKAVAR
jgi:hypothetical protein